jgi:pimeloyl-ACP methyl ester carboxylesterase
VPSLKKSLPLISFPLIWAAALALPSLALAAGAAKPTQVQSDSVTISVGSIFTPMERRALTANVAEYSFKVRVGSGPYDQIGLHRVVKESAPNVPIRASRAVFLAHGDIWNFRAAFLTGAKPLPVFLAEQGVDVWGIDFRWTSVPASVTDFAFMKKWGIEQDARDLGVGIAAARFTRALTGSGYGKVFLLGWSRGGQIGYAYLNGESQVPSPFQQVRGFIPVDIYLKTDVEQFRTAACQRQQATEALIAAGTYASTNGVLIATLGNLAVSNPGGPSILDPNLTNRQAGLLVGEATFTFFPGVEPAPFYHFTGGTFDAQSRPTGLLYSNEADLFTFEQRSSPFQPNRELADADKATCDQMDVAFDDHLEDITIPVFYVGAGGGFGELGIYTTTLLGSSDVTSLVIHKTPPAARIADYGHADLFLANDAQTLVWQPILSWIQAH